MHVKAVALQLERIVEKTAVASLTGWTPEKIDMVR